MIAYGVSPSLDRMALGHRLGASDRRVIFLIALAVRMIAFACVSVFLAFDDRETLFPDERQYLRHAGAVADGGDSVYGYANLLGALFKITDQSAWLPRLVNVFAGAILAVVVYEILKLVVRRSVARGGGLVVALWPSLILWSVAVLRDSLLLLALAVTLWGLCVVLRGDWRGLVPALAAASLIHEWRVYAFFLITVAVVVAGVAHLIVRRRSLFPVVALIIGFGVIGWLGGSGPFAVGFVRHGATIESVSYTRTVGSDATTGFASADPRSVGDVVEGIPKGFVNSMFGPFPWRFDSPVVAGVLLIELLPWYALLLLGIAGVWRLGRRVLSGIWLWSGAFTLGAIVVFSVYGANAGTILRQRAMLIVPLILLAAARFDAVKTESFET